MASIGLGGAERSEISALRERQVLIRLVEKAISSRSDSLRGIKEELRQEGCPVDCIPLYKNSIKLYLGSNSKRVSSKPAQAGLEAEAKTRMLNLRKRLSSAVSDGIRLTSI
jgi:hypothetical protein